MFRLVYGAILIYILVMAPLQAEPYKLIDTHIHYSHDAWEMWPPERAVALLRNAGVNKAFVSSSSDQGTQMLYSEAPDLIIPVLRPYRKRGELSTWVYDDSLIDMIAGLLATNTYAGIGEFHVFGTDADLPIVQAIAKMAVNQGIFLHAHSDVEAVERLFRQFPDAHILWAHSGFAEPDTLRDMLERHATLKADLAFRQDYARNGKLDPSWLQLFRDFPTRFMLGTDTYTPERWYFVDEQANWNQEWLANLGGDLAENLAWRNAQNLADWALANK